MLGEALCLSESFPCSHTPVLFRLVSLALETETPSYYVFVLFTTFSSGPLAQRGSQTPLLAC